jgi:uncharacterized membrane protein YfcA
MVFGCRAIRWHGAVQRQHCISAALGIVAVSATVGHWAPRSRDWQAVWVNMIGCGAFAISAVGAFVFKTGTTADEAVANTGTFVGALCFLAAALMVLPRFTSQAESSRGPSRRHRP